MKKFILLVLPFYFFTFLPLKADEGMWTLYNLPNAVYETMKQENYQLPYGALYQGEEAVKNCVVRASWFHPTVWCSLTTIAVSKPSARILP